MKFSQIVQNSFLEFTALLLLSGCGGGTQGTGGFDSGFSESRLLRTLSPSERAQLCDRFTSFYRSVFVPDVLCPYVGVAVALDNDSQFSQSSACEIGTSLCRDKFDTLLADIPQASCPFSANEPIDCDIKIGVVDKCLSDVADFFVSAFSDVQCSNLPDRTKYDDLNRLFEEDREVFPKTPACEEFKAKCADSNSKLKKGKNEKL